MLPLERFDLLPARHEVVRAPEDARQQPLAHLVDRVRRIEHHDDRVAVEGHAHRLMAGRMAGGRKEHDPPVSEQVVLAAEQLPAVVALELIGHVGVGLIHRRIAGECHLPLLDVDLGVPKEREHRSVVVVEVRHDDLRYRPRLETDRRQQRRDRVVLVHLEIEHVAPRSKHAHRVREDLRAGSRCRTGRGPAGDRRRRRSTARRAWCRHRHRADPAAPGRRSRRRTLNEYSFT